MIKNRIVDTAPSTPAIIVIYSPVPTNNIGRNYINHVSMETNLIILLI